MSSIRFEPHQRPTLPETAAVLAALSAYRQTLGLPGGEAADTRLYLEELKASIERVEGVTIQEEHP